MCYSSIAAPQPAWRGCISRLLLCFFPLVVCLISITSDWALFSFTEPSGLYERYVYYLLWWGCSFNCHFLCSCYRSTSPRLRSALLSQIMMQLHHKKQQKKVALTTNFYLLIYLFLVEVVQTLKKRISRCPHTSPLTCVTLPLHPVCAFMCLSPCSRARSLITAYD